MNIYYYRDLDNCSPRVYVFPMSEETETEARIGFSVFKENGGRRGFDWSLREMKSLGCKRVTRDFAEKVVGRKTLRKFAYKSI